MATTLTTPVQVHWPVNPLNHEDSITSDPLGCLELGDRSNSVPVMSRMFILSASGSDSADQQISNVTTYLKERSNERDDGLLEKLASSLAQCPPLLAWKAAVPASSYQLLISYLEEGRFRPTMTTQPPKLGFIFSGVGGQYHSMGRELMRDYDVFATAIEKADKHLKTLGAEWSLKDELYKDTSSSSSIINRVDVAIPATTAIQIGLVLLLRSWNITPVAVNANSTGETAAAFTAGAFDFETSIFIAFQRGTIAGKVKEKRPDLKGAVLAIGSTSSEIQPLLKDLTKGRLDIGAILGPNLISVAGDERAVCELQEILKSKKVFCKRTPMQLAYHSFHMHSVAPDFLTALHDIQPQDVEDGPTFYSSLAGERIESTKSLTSAYWVYNLLGQVNLLDAELNLCNEQHLGQTADEIDALVEIGPHPTFKKPINDILKSNPWGENVRYLSTLERGKDAVLALQELACELFAIGYPLDVAAVNSVTKEVNNQDMLADLPAYIACRYCKS